MVKQSSHKKAPAHEFTFKRTFAASREVVFDVWTDSHKLAKWWGPHEFTNPVCKIDPKPGGSILIHMRGPDGQIHPMKGAFRDIKRPELLSFTSFVEDKDGNTILKALNIITFVAEGTNTKITLEATVVKAAPEAAQMVEGMQEGWSQSLERLKQLVEKN